MSYEQRSAEWEQQQKNLEIQKQALEMLKSTGATGTFCSDAMSVNIVVDKVRLTYSEKDGLRLVAIDNDREIDLTDSFRIMNISFGPDYPKITGQFALPQRSIVRPAGSIEAMDASGINAQIAKVHEGLRAKKKCTG